MSTENSIKKIIYALKLFVFNVLLIVLIRLVFIPDNLDSLIGLFVTFFVIDAATESKVLQRLSWAIEKRFSVLFWTTCLAVFFCFQPRILQFLNDNVSEDYLTWVNPALNIVLIPAFAGMITYGVCRYKKKFLQASTPENTEVNDSTQGQKNVNRTLEVKFNLTENYEENSLIQKDK